MALLGSAIFSTILCEAGVPFRPSLNLAIDLTVIMWILVGWMDGMLKGNYGKLRDVPILVLFLPIWALYFVEVDWRSYAIDALIAIQLLLTFPVKRTFELAKRLKKNKPDNDGQMRRAAA